MRRGRDRRPLSIDSPSVALFSGEPIGSLEPGLLSGLPCRHSGPRTWLSSADLPLAVRREMNQKPGLELETVWDATATGSRFTRHAMVSTPT